MSLKHSAERIVFLRWKSKETFVRLCDMQIGNHLIAVFSGNAVIKLFIFCINDCFIVDAQEIREHFVTVCVNRDSSFS